MLLPLEGAASASRAEYSGMAWYGETLVLLPQYPSRFSRSGDGALLGIAKADILAYLDGKSTEPLKPRSIPLQAGGIASRLRGFEGFESIAFAGERVFLTIETSPGKKMLGYLISGTVAPDLASITLDPDRLAEIQPQADFSNQSDEALLVWGERIFTFYEANGAKANPSPVAHIFDFSLQPQGTLPIPNLEYRLTDVTPPDAQGRFWAINYFFPGDTHLLSLSDPLAEKYGKGPTHARSAVVERLVELQLSPDRISLNGTPPIQLELLGDGSARNWEGIAPLDGRGFLLVTDTHPETLLGFVGR